MPVVAETYDGRHNDIDGQHVTEADALAALDGARAGPVAEGNVGGGNGMRSYQFKGGTGTASRAVAIDGRAYTVAALVQSNPNFTIGTADPTKVNNIKALYGNFYNPAWASNSFNGSAAASPP